MKFFDRFS